MGGGAAKIVYLSPVRPITALSFENRYARLHPAFYEVVDPTPLPDPYLVAFNPDAGALLGLDPAAATDPELPLYLSGAKRIPGSEPIAQAYAGHQFGVWVPQLGDGRAFLLGQVRHAGATWDLHLKGGGKTRFSRFGDGRAVLRSVIREYLASEALHGLGIPTSRALSIVGSDAPVQRETVETAATLIRLAPSHVRFGTFEYFASRGEVHRVRELADHVISGHFPDLAGDPDRIRRLFGEVTRRTGALMARWMAAGFAHGVMNTDNMSILGLTLDYGPYGFLDDYDPDFICNHSDVDGRYAFGHQPGIGMWNCARLGEALLVTDPALGDRRAPGSEPDPALAGWQEELESYWEAFTAEYGHQMRARLGLITESEADAALFREMFALLRDRRADYTGFLRSLGTFDSVRAAWAEGTSPEPAAGEDRTQLDGWAARYAARLKAEGSVDAERGPRMQKVNPKYVLRNWIAQEAIERAERKEFGLIEDLRRLFAAPYDEHPGMERYAEPPTLSARSISVSCSS
jgi:serine/tyrosine/threonine adenylyltransferase